MLITGARVAMSSSRTSNRNLWLHNGLVSFSRVHSAEASILDLNRYLVFPGLINAHDHLDLNLFPKLGRGPYESASAWARDVYKPHEAPVKQHLQVPKPLRLQWGGIKNLISGVTTVAHHNAFHSVFLEPSFPVRVMKRYGWAHSVEFSPDWERRFRGTPANYPFIIHAAEGTDEAARREIGILASAGAIGPSTVLVHGVGIGSSDVPLLRRANTSVVWCPTSNHFTLKRSLDAALLNSGIPIALGSDSAMTADGDLLDELRAARRTMNAHRLYRMVTSEAARILKLPTGFGKICDGGPADLLVMRDSGETPAKTLLENRPELIVIAGRIQLMSLDCARSCPPDLSNSLQQIEVEGRGRYLISGDVSSLVAETIRTLQDIPRLAGKAIAG